MRVSALVMLSAKLKASSEKKVTTRTICDRAVDITRAGTGTSAVLARPRNRGMSSSSAATKRTSAAMSVQAR